MDDWQKLIVGAYYGCEISPLKDGAIQPGVTYWWNGSGWVEGRLPRHLWKGHKECRRRYRYSLKDEKCWINATVPLNPNCPWWALAGMFIGIMFIGYGVLNAVLG